MSTYSTFLISPDINMEDNGLYKNYLQMDLILKKLFTIKNPRPIIDFLNAIYGDAISYDAKISYSDKETINRKRNSAKLMLICILPLQLEMKFMNMKWNFKLNSIKKYL